MAANSLRPQIVRALAAHRECPLTTTEIYQHVAASGMAAGTFSLSLSRLDIENPPDDIHRWRRTNSIVTGLWLLAFVQSRAKSSAIGLTAQ